MADIVFLNHSIWLLNGINRFHIEHKSCLELVFALKAGGFYLFCRLRFLKLFSFQVALLNFF